MAVNLFISLSLAVVFAVIVSGFMRMLKQPLIVGYIFAGIIIGPYFFNLFSTNEIFETLSQLGIAFLLFMVGMHLNPRAIKEVGKVSLITGIGQIIFTSIIGFLISLALGFSILVSVYISIALTFSSTIIITKLLYDKKDIDSLYGKIAVGFLIVQDLAAIIILMVVSSYSDGASLNLWTTLLKGFIILSLLFAFSFFVLPKLVKRAAKSSEFLVLFSVGWALAVASLFHYLNFSLEIGALLAGMALSLSPFSVEISSKMKPLRDFFIVLFFIIIGSQIVFLHIAQNILPIILFSLFILIGNPLIVMIIMKYFGYTKRTGFFAGLTVAQISEFSIILVALGVSVGHLTPEILSIVTMIGLITITGSTYLILYSNSIYQRIYKYLSIFEKKKINADKKLLRKKYDSILFGYNRTGFEILRALNKLKKNSLVVDFNPDTIAVLKKFKIPNLYGDAEDLEFLNELNLDKTELIVSTAPDYETNILLIDFIRHANSKAVVIMRADNLDEALELYKKGADYILTPAFLGGEHISKMIDKFKINKKEYDKEKEKHIKKLEEALKKDKII
ncbi:cation:proton antiporter [Candidatus Pacearchaeota archaeon]|nr:cation:proton antiporter [Candidatus Pacearchaeota archaeon]